jgi:hypothetical protein
MVFPVFSPRSSKPALISLRLRCGPFIDIEPWSSKVIPSYGRYLRAATNLFNLTLTSTLRKSDCSVLSIHPSISDHRCVKDFRSSPHGWWWYFSASREDTSGLRPSTRRSKAFCGRAATAAWATPSRFLWITVERAAATCQRLASVHSGFVL